MCDVTGSVSLTLMTWMDVHAPMLCFGIAVIARCKTKFILAQFVHVYVKVFSVLFVETANHS